MKKLIISGLVVVVVAIAAIIIIIVLKKNAANCVEGSSWSGCSKVCGTGTQTRTGDIPASGLFGKKCSSNSRDCNTHDCFCKWGPEFQPWTACSRECGDEGVMYRHRLKHPGGLEQGVYEDIECNWGPTMRKCNRTPCELQEISTPELQEISTPTYISNTPTYNMPSPIISTSTNIIPPNEEEETSADSGIIIYQPQFL